MSVLIAMVAMDDSVIALSSEDSETASAAEQALIGVGTSSVEALLVAMESPKPQVRFRAGYALGKIKDHRALHSLIGAATNDSDEAVRYDATLALGDLGDSRAVAPLLELMQGLDPVIPSAAAMALVRIGSPAVESLGTLLSDCDCELRSLALSTLGGIRDPRVVGLLAKHVEDENESVRVSVAEALGEVGDAEAVQALGSMVADADESVREVVQYWLKQCEERDDTQE